MLRQIGALFLSLLAPVLLVLAFPDYHISSLAWIAFVPLFFAIDNSSRVKSGILPYLAGLIFFGGTLYWLTHVTKLGYIVITLYSALFFGMFGLFANILIIKLRASKMAFLIFLVLPALWVSLEFIRGFLFTGFPWAILGYSQYKNPAIIQIADITGSYGVSFIIMMVNVTLYACLSNLFRRRPRFRALAFQVAMSIGIIIAVTLYGYAELGENDVETGLRLSVVQGNIEQAKKWDPYYRGYILDRYEILTREAAKDGGDLIVWPETAVPGLLGDEDVSPRIEAVAKKINIPILLGAATYKITEGNSSFFNSAVLFSADGYIEKQYEKLHLVPLGEYIPFEKYFPSFRDFIDVPIGDYTAGEEFTIFDIKSKNEEGFKYAVIICFEDIFSGLVRRFALDGIDFAINITNDAWFAESSEQLQHAQASVFRAVENRISVVRAANTGFSCYISPKGIIKDSIYDATTGSMYIEGQKAFRLQVSKKDTLYTRYGDIFVYICLLLVLEAALIPNR